MRVSVGALLRAAMVQLRRLRRATIFLAVTSQVCVCEWERAEGSLFNEATVFGEIHQNFDKQCRRPRSGIAERGPLWAEGSSTSRLGASMLWQPSLIWSAPSANASFPQGPCAKECHPAHQALGTSLRASC